MRRVKDCSDRRFTTIKWKLLLLAFLFCVFFISLIFIHRIVEENAQSMGNEIIANYSLEALDVLPENFNLQTEKQKLPEGSVYYICDSKGTLIYKAGGKGVEKKELEENYQMLYQQVINCRMTGETGHSYNKMGIPMTVYHQEADNGWMFILAIPRSYLNWNWDMLVLLYVFAFVVSMSMMAIMWVRETRKSKEIKKMNETVQILGNSYYAFYKINIKERTYEMIKGSDYLKARLKPYGNYKDWLKVVQEVIIGEEYPEFFQSFSIENMHYLMKQHTKNFGGDFRRLFGGEYQWVNVRMLFSSDMNSDEVVLCFRKIEDEKKWQLKRMALLEDALRAANLSENSQKQFFSNISHDMRTPLNVIIGMSELAEACAEEPEKVRDYLQKINFSSKQLLGLINGILEVSRMEKGIILDSEQFNLRNLAEECVNVFQSKAKEENKELSFACRIQHEMVYGDELRLEQIMNNLISNAMKFTKNGDRVSVDVCEIDSQEHAKYQITVEDTGIGMSEEFVKRIFEPYEREQRFGAQGTGLGMPIVKSLVSLMGGEITVKSTPNGGSIFTVTLPLETAEIIEEESEEETSIDEVMDLSQKTILLVEDYDLNMELTTDILKMNGANVLQAWNGLEAVEAFQTSEEFSIDAILMDMQMPKMDGCEAARCIRGMNRADAGKVPIIALTANAFAEDIAKTSEAGMNAHISKPLDVKILCNTLKKYMVKSME